MPDTDMNPSDTAESRQPVRDLHTAAFDRERIDRVAASLRTIQTRIDQAYGHICTDLPEIHRGIHLTCEQATETLDSLNSSGPAGMIDALTDRLDEFFTALTRQSDSMVIATERSLEIIGSVDHCFRKIPGVSGGSSQRTAQPADSGLTESLSAFTNAMDDLGRTAEEHLRLQCEYRDKLDHARGVVMPSLAHSLGVMIDILRDLISRSNAMKNPILKIMSGLQTHDIVNQDITTIIRGLDKVLNPGQTPGDSEMWMDFLLFQEKVSLLSLDLIGRLIAVVRAHGRDLEQEMRHIEGIICNAKEDKDALSELLLLNAHSKSSFDLLRLEITEVLDDLASTSESLAQLDSLKGKNLSLALASFSDIESSANDACSRLIPSIRGPLLELSVQMTGNASNSAGCAEALENVGTIRDLAAHGLDRIRQSMIESIEGIDVCTAGFLRSTARFREDVDCLMKTLEGSESVLEDLRGFTASTRTEIGKNAVAPDREIVSREFAEIVHRLQNPHSGSLSPEGGDEPEEDRLTLF